MNIIHLCVGIAYCAFIAGGICAYVGQMTGGPYLITWWDAIWVTFCIAIFPFMLGMSVFLPKKEGANPSPEGEKEEV